VVPGTILYSPCRDCWFHFLSHSNYSFRASFNISFLKTQNHTLFKQTSHTFQTNIIHFSNKHHTLFKQTSHTFPTNIIHFSNTHLFGSLFSSNSTLDDSHIPSPSDAPLINPMSLPFISFHAVKKILLSLDTSKAYWQDGIPPCVIKEFDSEFAPVLARLFRFCLKTQTFPLSWKHALYSLF